MVPTMFQHPDVWSDGRWVTHEVANFECCGAAVFVRLFGEAWFQWELGQTDLLFVPGPQQSVQCAEIRKCDFSIAGCGCCACWCG